MDTDALARAAIDALGRHLAAPQQGDDTLYHLIGRRIGYRPVTDFAERRGHPGRLVAEVADAARRDPGFADALDQATRQHAHEQNHARFSRSPFSGNSVGGNLTQSHSGNVVHGSYKVKHGFKIGSLNISTGGLAVGVVALIALGGGTAAVVASAGDSVTLAQATGRWEHKGGTTVPGMTTDPFVLTVAADGAFTFTFGVSATTETGFDGVKVKCAGTVHPDGDHFSLRATSGECGTFTAKPGPDSTTLDVAVDDQTIAFRKVR